MASNKDILDAQRFNRRRLVTAFVAGAPGGRELEPRRVAPGPATQPTPPGSAEVWVAVAWLAVRVGRVAGR